MGFVFKRIEKIGYEPFIEEINEDYHNGDCIIMQPMNELDHIKDHTKYFVIDYKDYLVLIYPSKFQ